MFKAGRDKRASLLPQGVDLQRRKALLDLPEDEKTLGLTRRWADRHLELKFWRAKSRLPP